MTIICAYGATDGNSVAFASDRMVQNSHIKRPLPYPKWFNLGSDNVHVGFAGYHTMNLAFKESSGSDMRAMAEKGDSSLTRHLQAIAGEVMPKPGSLKEFEDGFDCHGILIVPGVGMYDIDCNLTAIRIPAGRFVAVGSGMHLAMGAVHGLTPYLKDEPHRLVYAAVKAACDLNTGCGGPIDVFTINRDFQVSHHEHSV